MADNTTTSSRSEADILKILIATDIHLGFEEKDPIRGKLIVILCCICMKSKLPTY